MNTEIKLSILCILLYSNYVFNIPITCTHTVEYIYLFICLSNLSYMFRRILHHPRGELLLLKLQHIAFINTADTDGNRNLKHVAERRIFPRRWHFRETMRLNERCVENVDVHDMPAKPEMFIHRLILTEKHYTNRNRNHNPYVVTAFCLCTRSSSTASQEGQAVCK